MYTLSIVVELYSIIDGLCLSIMVRFAAHLLFFLRPQSASLFRCSEVKLEANSNSGLDAQTLLSRVILEPPSDISRAVAYLEKTTIGNNASLLALASRVGMAEHMLSFGTMGERATLRRSLALQPQYFRQECRVVFDGQGLLIVEKPFDTQVQTSATNLPRCSDERTVECWLRERGLWPAQPCHTLDFATSGLLVLARSDGALAAASRAFDHSQTTGSGGFTAKKEYLAVVLGWPQWGQRNFDAPISADPTSEFKMKVVCGSASVAEANSAVVDPLVAARWGPSRLPPAPRWLRDSRSLQPRHASTSIEVPRSQHPPPLPQISAHLAQVFYFTALAGASPGHACVGGPAAGGANQPASPRARHRSTAPTQDAPRSAGAPHLRVRKAVLYSATLILASLAGASGTWRMLGTCLPFG